MIHTFLDTTIEFNIIFKKRKSVGIYVDIYGQIEVHAPKGTPIDTIHQVLENHWDSIIQKSKEMKDRTAAPMEKVYDHGEVFLYLGTSYPIVISTNLDQNQDYVMLEKDKLHVYVKQHNDETVRQALKRFYYRQCKTLVEARIRIYQPEFKMKPRSIRIMDDSSNWGTCNSRLELTFNWKLAMAPIEAIDYVVVHEMCHMVHLNHDRSFWRLVGKLR
ncbi:MAG: zinc metalloprotease [Herbinix sp.]|nr:zinc metalloprotease [Herbinix sp.]